MLLHEDVVFGQPLPNKLLECVESFDQTDFYNKKDFNLMLNSDCCLKFGVETGFISRKLSRLRTILFTLQNLILPAL
jgi:hypothetical protein